MGSLSNLYISQSYTSLIHLGSDGPITTASVELQDGLGNGLGIFVNSLGDVNISGDISASNIPAEITSKGEFNAYTSSTNVRLNNLETTSASVNVSVNALNVFTASQSSASIVASINNLNTFTQSANIRLNNLESTSASVNVSITNINSTTASLNTSVANINLATASLQSQLATIGTQSGSWVTEAETASFARTNVTNTFTEPQIINAAITASAARIANLNYPIADGTFTGQVLQTNAAGTLSFGNVNAVFENVRNGELTTITVGTPLYVSGAQGDTPIVYRADATNPTKMPVTFVAMESIASNATGRGIILGLITGINMTGYPVGTQLWVDGIGQLTDVRPTGSADIVQPIGIVTKTGNGGQLNILNPGPVLLPNIQTGYAWVGNGNNQPVAVSTGSWGGGTTTNTGSLMVTGSVNVNVLTFTKGDGTTFDLTVAASGSVVPGTISGSAQITALGFVSSSVTASSLITASFDNGTRNLTFTKGDNTTFAVNIPDVSGSAGNFVTTSSFNAYTASNDQRVSSLEVNSASVNISITNLNASSASQQVSIDALNTFTSSANQRLTAIETVSGSWITENETGSFAILGANQIFTGNNTFIGNTVVSQSAAFGTASFYAPMVISNGINSNVQITGSLISNKVSVFNFDTLFYGSQMGGTTAQGTFFGYGSTDYTSTIGAYTGGFDNELQTFIDSTGIYLKDFNGSGYTTFLKLLPNSGNNPKPIFTRGLEVTGSTNIAELTASLQQGYVWVGASNGRTTTVATSSFGGGGGAAGATLGANTFTGSQTISLSNGEFRVTNPDFPSYGTVAFGLSNASNGGIYFKQSGSILFEGAPSDNRITFYGTGSFTKGIQVGPNEQYGNNLFLRPINGLVGAGYPSGSAIGVSMIFGRAIDNTPTKFTAVDVTIDNDLIVTGSLTASLTQGYTWVGDSTGKTALVATSSFGGGAIDTSSFAILGANQIFTGNNTFTGNTVVSQSATFGTASFNGPVVIGKGINSNVQITGSLISNKVSVFDFDTLFYGSQLGGTTANGTSFGYGSTDYTQTIGAYGGGFDNELQIYANNNGIEFRDFNQSGYPAWLKLGPNSGTNPAPAFVRGLDITGSLQHSGSHRHTGETYISGNIWVSGSINLLNEGGNGWAFSSKALFLTNSVQTGLTVESPIHFYKQTKGNMYITVNAEDPGSSGSMNLQVHNNQNLNISASTVIVDSDLYLDDEAGTTKFWINKNFDAEFLGTKTEWNETGNTLNVVAAEETVELIYNGWGTGYDNGYIVNVSTNGTQFQDWNTSYVNQTWLKIPVNNNDNPAPVFTRGLIVTGSVNVSTVLQLAQQNPLPSGADGQMAVSGSNLYFYSGSAWNRIAFA